MLSIENPPPDPPCPCQIPQLKSGDEKAKLALPDLFNSGLDDDNNPLPNFSIRNYVFGSRSKDIRTNWPFSEENLQLCLKHGVTDPLPPFQALDTVRRDPSVKKRCTVEDNLIEEQNISHPNDELSRRPNDQFVSATSNSSLGLCNQNLALDCVNINSSGSEGDKEFPSTSHPEVDSVPTSLSPCSALETDTLVEASAEKLEAHKSESTIQPPARKCRLIVKLSNVVDPSTNEEITNNFMASETMASKVCPVCKNFSSSSNTTLNAHIDQCLSGESTMKWAAESKVIKHRIKPRKTRLMVDIYTTAPYCTLEELDRRNGTTWATNSNLPIVQEIELRAEERVQRQSTANLEEDGHEGAVYIDTSGKKVRILSKFNGSVSRVEHDLGPRKLLKGDKGSKFLLTKKGKKPHGQKQQKFLKLAPHRKNFYPPKSSHNFETRGGQERGQERKFSIHENHEEEERQTQRFKDDHEQTKLDDSGRIQRWVRSKRTGLAKKTSPGYNATKDLLVESDPSSSGDSCVKRSCMLKTQHSSNPISSPESGKRMETSSYEPQVDEYREQASLRERVGFSSSGSQINGYGKRSLVLPKRNSKQLRKEGTPLHDSQRDPPNHTENLASSPTIKAKKSDTSVMSSEPSWGHHPFSCKARRFSSLRKNLLSSKAKVDKPHDMSHGHTEEQSRMKETTDNMSLDRTSFFKIRRRRGAIKTSRKERTSALKTTKTLAPQCYGRGGGEPIDLSVRVSSALADTFDDEASAMEEQVQTRGDHIDVEGSFMSFSKSQCDSQRRMDIYQGRLCGAEDPICTTEPSLGAEQEMICAEDEAGHGVIGQNSHMAAELDSKDGQRNYFSEVVDAISIPGPPGSFLPSLEDMGSEDLQGNSSLTTSRVQSSEDHLDMVDRNSSDSPISAISNISNPMFARSDSRSSEKLSGIDPVVESCAPVPQAAIVGAERISQDELKVDSIFPERRPLSLKNDQPCCCSRKEGGTSQGVALNYQESQLLRRRTMGSVPQPAIGKQWSSNDPTKRPITLHSRTEMFCLSNYPSSGPEKVKFPIRGDCDSASPSSSNPVLRLMGKNLMVVNKDEDVSMQHRPALSNDHPNLQFCTVSGVSTGNVQNEDYRSFHQVVSQSPRILSQSKHDTVGPHFDVSFPNNFRGHVDLKTPHTPLHTSGLMFPSPRPQRNPPTKEIIIIDDTPDSKADSAADVMYNDGMRSRVSSSGVSVPMASEYNSRHVNPFYGYQSQGSSPYCGSPVVHNASFQMPPSMAVNASPVKWNCSPEGSSSALHPSSLTASSPSTVHPKPMLYYSPSFS